MTTGSVHNLHSLGLIDPMKNFALIGAGGYIAPRHLRAIKDTGHNLSVAVDKNDSVGVLDSYFPRAMFFTEFDQFFSYIDQRVRTDERIDYVSIVSPNHLHEAHLRCALRAGADAICEKPLVLSVAELDGLATVEAETGRRVSTILQLRLHPSIVALRAEITAKVAADPAARFDVELTYLTSRGPWYHASWKANEKRSGGVAANIGIHFFDMLGWLFGGVTESRTTFIRHDAASGILELPNARVRWFLSIDDTHLPEAVVAANQRTYRSIRIDGHEVEFSEGFGELHTDSYRNILAGQGFGIDEARPSIELVEGIRHATPTGLVGDVHPFARLHI